MSQLIRNWEELDKIPKESKTHTLEVNVWGGSAWLKAKNRKPYKSKYSYMRQAPHLDHYLSTHTFYKDWNREATKILKVCGFDVEIVCCEEE